MNVKLVGKLLNFHLPILTAMRVFEHTVYLFFKEVTKISIMNQIIIVHSTMYNDFRSFIYHNPCSIFKSKLYEFHNSNIEFYLVLMITEWPDILWFCKDNCA